MGLITHALSFTKESATEFVFEPLFVQNDIRDIIKIRTDIQGSEKLNYFSALDKITKGYQSGTAFTPSTGVTLTQRTLTVSKMKAEVQQRGSAFFDSVMESELAKAIDWDNIDGTIFNKIVSQIFAKGLARDLQRQIFLGDTTKEVGLTAVLDENYKEYNGLWTTIIADFKSVVLPAAQRITLSNAAVKQVGTTTLTGTSGTANITINGTAYLATFNSSLTQTATDFVASHAATILAREYGHVLTSSGAGVILTSGVEGVAFLMSASVNVSGDLAGNNVATTANVLPADLGVDEAQTAMQDMWEAMPDEMDELQSELRYIVTRSFYENYRKTLEADGTEQAHTNLVNGQATLNYRGIPLIKRQEWDTHIGIDFAGYYPHRALLTIPENLVFGTDMNDADQLVEEFYIQEKQINVFRVQYKGGTNYTQTNFIVAAY